MSHIDTADWQILSACNSLQNGGAGLRFEVLKGEQRMPAFAIKQGDGVYAYLNQCAHVAMEMDWQPGQFFDFDHQYVMCATHGALYEPSTGLCVSGPCIGKRLHPVTLRIENDLIYAPQRL
jgi:nitrite reductase/ring-hydroxylating ferredoxin subunit